MAFSPRGALAKGIFPGGTRKKYLEKPFTAERGGAYHFEVKGETIEEKTDWRGKGSLSGDKEVFFREPYLFKEKARFWEGRPRRSSIAWEGGEKFWGGEGEGGRFGGGRQSF